MKKSIHRIFLYIWAVGLFFSGFTMNASNSVLPQKFFINTSVKNVDGSRLGIKAGDSVFVESGHRDYLRFVNIHGDSLNYVYISNYGGSVEVSNTNFFYGIQFFDCSYFRFSGTGSENEKYGIKITHTPTNTNGLSLDGASTNYEVDHIEVSNTGFAGICANPKPDCDDKLNRGNFTCRNTSFHDNYIHKTSGEGFYVGHSFYTGYTISCGDSTRFVYPHELKGLRIYNNNLDSCGYDGIQVGCATTDCEIYGNTVTNYGALNVVNQNFGIIIGGGTGGKCYNNTIMNGTSDGINVFGIGNNLIYNNIIINPGHAMTPEMQTGDAIGIFCDDRSTIPGSSFYFLNNTIVCPKSDGFRLFTTVSKNNVIANNVILKPGSLVNYSDVSKSFVNLAKNVDAHVSNNYFGTNTPNLGQNYISDLYNFCQTLPIIDQGIDVSSYEIKNDFFGKNRVLINSCDIGAFEYEKPFQQQKPSSIKVVSKTNDDKLEIYSTVKEIIQNVSIYQLTGQMIYSNNPNEDAISITMKDKFNKGVYVVCVTTNNDEYKNKISVNF